jgi:hypothetical protein
MIIMKGDNNIMEHHQSFLDVLQNLEPGTEVNVHLERKTLYNAVFRKFNQKSGIAYFLIDQFYQIGNFLVPISVQKIISIDLPKSVEEVIEGVTEGIEESISAGIEEGISAGIAAGIAAGVTEEDE